MRIKRILNNNAVVSLDENENEVILLGSGIAFKRKIDDEIRDDEVDAMLEEELIKEAAMVEKALLAKPGIQEVTPEETEAAFQRFLLKLKQSEIQDPELGVVL